MPKSADFWNDRFAGEDYFYGVQPNTFVESATGRWLPPVQDVLALGAGEGRNAVYLAQHGHTVTAVDYAAEGLRKTERLAEEAGVEVETTQADVRDWHPDRQWDAVIVTFLHLPSSERPRLYRLLQHLLRPEGLLVAEWFRPEQITEGYDSGGPPSVDLMVTPEELREHFSDGEIEHLESAKPFLEEGPYHRGPGATVRFVWRAPSDFR